MRSAMSSYSRSTLPLALLGTLCLGITSLAVTGCSDDDGGGDCLAGEIDCGNGFCVDSAYVCDGTDDCGNGADEVGCTGCETFEYDCGNGVCIDDSLVCDNVDDCGNGADEIGCTGCLATELDCGNGVCVDNAVVCDFVDDCGNGEDEIGCGCDPVYEYECDDGSCVDASAECDFLYNDCLDFSDELACEGCLADEIACDVDGDTVIDCVGEELTCDGYDDCFDGLDEHNC